MAPVIRDKSNFVSGTVDDNPLASGGTTLTSTELADLAAISSPTIAVIILDADGSAGDPEIVHVTAHTGSATTATITRAREGTSAREHVQNTDWTHGPTASDFTPNLGNAQEVLKVKDDESGMEWSSILLVDEGNSLVKVVNGQLDVEGYAALGNGLAPDATVTLFVDRDFDAAGGTGAQIRVGGIITHGSGTGATSHIAIIPGGTVINSGNVHNFVSSFEVHEPNITETSGSVGTASTVRIVTAPTEGNNNYALFVDSGRARFDGAISAGTDDGTSGEQLTSGGAGAATSWTAASCLPEAKVNISKPLGFPDADIVLAKMISISVRNFHYRPKEFDEDGDRIRSTPSTGDSKTEYTGPMAAEFPEVMHYEGRILNPISTFGYTMLSFKALEKRVAMLEAI